MTDWQIQSSYNGTMVTADTSWRNVVGIPIVSVTIIDPHQAGANTCPSGVFRFTMESTTTASILAQHYADLKSPVLYSGARTVVADGVTANKNLLPGLSIVLSNAAVSGDVFEVGVGCYWDSDAGLWDRILPLDLNLPGTTSDSVTLSAKNVSGNTQCNSQLVVTNCIRVVNTQSPVRPFMSFQQTGLTNPTADTNLSGKPVTFTDFVEGSPNLVSILVNGAGLDVYDVTNSALIGNGTDLKCDGTTIYRFADSTILRSGEFILASTLAVTDSATIHVSDGSDFIEIATSTDSFVSGTSGIYLTELDAPEGVVSNGAQSNFRIRQVGPPGKTTALNQRLYSLRVQSEGI